MFIALVAAVGLDPKAKALRHDASQKTSSAYVSYEKKQASKLGSGATAESQWISTFDQHLERSLHAQLVQPPLIDIIGSPVLCVGARLGGEVRAFQALPTVKLAVGIDFNPGGRNAHVLYGDAHRLQFKNGSFGSVYTNVMDHILKHDIFAREARRVLKPRGTLLVWLQHQALKEDGWAVHDLIQERPAIERTIEGAGFELVSVRDVGASKGTGGGAASLVHQYVYRKR